MKVEQRRYAMERVRDEASRQDRELREKFTTTCKKLTVTEKWNLIRQCRVDLLPGHKLRQNMSLIDAHDFSSEEGSTELDTAAYGKASRALSKKRDKVLDEIMLGDEKKAIKLIRAFCKTD